MKLKKRVGIFSFRKLVLAAAAHFRRRESRNDQITEVHARCQHP